MKKCLICHERKIEGYGICEACKDLNRRMRRIHVDLTGYTAVVTGGRIKIGFATALRLLRDGAKVIVITRCPYDALDRYKKEPDYEEFKERLVIYGFNLMWVNKLDELIQFIKEQTPDGLDFLINNAAQTIKKTNAYYQGLEQQEQKMKQLHSASDCALLTETTLGKGTTPISVQILPDTAKDEASLIEGEENNKASEGENSKIDAEGDLGTSESANVHGALIMPIPQPLSVKEEGPFFNSWVAKAEEISVQEMLEVQLVNVTTPFMLVGQLKQWMKKSPHKNKFIINVSSVEGRFQKKKKLSRHVHTNMAKASLNMMTHSLSMEYEKEGIYMYGVDPGWVSNQFPSEYNASKDFEPYLTFEDAASRICYPIYTKLEEDKIRDAGSLWKDYEIKEY